MQTILGAGGVIGVETAKALSKYTQKIRLVSRNPKQVNAGEELFPADLTNAGQVLKAVEGSEVVYLMPGFPYNIKVWEATWPVVMQNTLEACKVHKARLVFFDNIYMYNPDYLSHMTEETPIGPTSKKGKVRARIAAMLMDEVEKGSIQALIARSADFYGPSIKNVSVLTETVFHKLAAGKTANWLGSARFKHSYTYTPDAGKATALLGNTDDAYNQVWHLPTCSDAMTGDEWVHAVANELGVKPRVMAAPKYLVRIMGLFDPVMKEIVEMMYQYDRDYIFDSSKFEKRFNYTPMAYAEGIKP
jgi:nucleoside-diphosphate-sugar epimerase